MSPTHRPGDGGRSKVVVVGAVPPPTHGVAIVIERILRSRGLAERFEIVHVDISDRRDLVNIGRWDWTNVRLAFTHWRQLVGALIRHRPDLVHIPLAHNYLGLLRDWTLLVTVLTASRAKVVGHIAGGGFGEFVENAAPWFRRLVLPAVRRCSTLIVSSHWHRDRISPVLPGSRLAIVRRGTESVDGSEPPPPDNGQLRVLFANSTLTEDKGVFDALQAAALCEEGQIDARWTFVGAFVSPDDERRAARLAEGLRSVEIVGPMERQDLLERYRTSHVFVFPPSPQEGFGLVRVEAMAAGLPVITTPAGGAGEVIEDGRQGFIVDYASPDQIAKRIGELQADSDLRSRLGRRAVERQQRYFSIESFERTLADAWLATLNVELSSDREGSPPAFSENAGT